MLQKYLNMQPRDRYDIVGALMGYINADPEFKTSEFDQALHYVFTCGIKEEELFVPFDPNVPFEEDREKWDKKYYSFARVYLKDNFCEKRLRHVKEVAKKLYPNVRETAAAKQTMATDSERQGGQQEPGKKYLISSAEKEKRGITEIPLIVKIVAAMIIFALLIWLIVAII